MPANEDNSACFRADRPLLVPLASTSGSQGPTHAPKEDRSPVTAASWARQYNAGLLSQLEHEANEGWPDLPWPPAEPAVLRDAEQVDMFRRLLAYLYDSLLAAERERVELARLRSRQTWLNTGRTKNAAA